MYPTYPAADSCFVLQLKGTARRKRPPIGGK
jgi:hypothetical protein